MWSEVLQHGVPDEGVEGGAQGIMPPHGCSGVKGFSGDGYCACMSSPPGMGAHLSGSHRASANLRCLQPALYASACLVLLLCNSHLPCMPGCTLQRVFL
mmetsp:Transcript_3673/g.7930  ORF Transcript_3673/g.7930 Transcript_3673/m.7930 type:complete len:99 (+) Transcript_3673:411-707(+)